MQPDGPPEPLRSARLAGERRWARVRRLTQLGGVMVGVALARALTGAFPNDWPLATDAFDSVVRIVIFLLAAVILLGVTAFLSASADEMARRNLERASLVGFIVTFAGVTSVAVAEFVRDDTTSPWLLVAATFIPAIGVLLLSIPDTSAGDED